MLSWARNTWLSVLHMLFYFLMITTLKGKDHFPHLKDKKNEDYQAM